MARSILAAVQQIKSELAQFLSLRSSIASAKPLATSGGNAFSIP